MIDLQKRAERIREANTLPAETKPRADNRPKTKGQNMGQLKAFLEMLGRATQLHGQDFVNKFVAKWGAISADRFPAENIHAAAKELHEQHGVPFAPTFTDAPQLDAQAIWAKWNANTTVDAVGEHVKRVQKAMEDNAENV